MTSLVQALGDRVVGSVCEVSANQIAVQLDSEAPHSTALNTAIPTGFPRINCYVLIPNESGATACVISAVRIEKHSFAKQRMSTREDFGLIDLPFPVRQIILTPLGTLKSRPAQDNLSFDVRRGVDIFPTVGDPVLLPTTSQLRAIVEGEDRNTASRILLGHCPTAGRAPVHVDPNKLFGRHVAVLGNTGAGKSCSVAGLIRWSLEAATDARVRVSTAEEELEKLSCVPNARFIVLDPNGEYTRAFCGYRVRLYRVEPEEHGEPLRVPAWLWNGDEWAAFTGAAPGVQRPVLFEALRHLRSGSEHPEKFETLVRGRAKRYQSRMKMLIQNSEHQKPGKREGVAQVLLNISTDFEDLGRSPDCPGTLVKLLMNVATEAGNVEESFRGNPKKGGGYWHDDFAEMSLAKITDALGIVLETIGVVSNAALDENTPLPFLVTELPDYVDALAADQSGRDVAQFVDTLNLRIRSLFAQRNLISILQPGNGNSITLKDWLNNYIGDDQAENGPVAVIDLSLVPSDVTHIVVSVLGRMIFEAVQRYRREDGQELPTTLVLEEAHTFVHRDLSGEAASPAARACARVFERIAREGRKFGLGLVLASQRPSEVSPTVLSQCNSFLLHRLVNDRDQELVKRLVPDSLGPLLRELPSLPTRRAILLGWAAPAPVLVEVRELPLEQRPHSPDPDFWAVWTGEQERTIDWEKIARSWQRIGESTPRGESE